MHVDIKGRREIEKGLLGDFPGGAVVKNPPTNAGDTGSSPGVGGASKSVRHDYWARLPQLRKPTCLEPMRHSKRSHCNEKPAQRNEE